MRIVVLMKQVPEVTEVEIDPVRGTLRREGVLSQTNPFDLHALEAGLTVRERLGGSVTVISMGPPQARAVISEAFSMGADDGILLSDGAFAGADTLATAFTLSQAIRRIGADLIITGLQSTDGDTAQVGPGVAELLGVPHASYVLSIEAVTHDDVIVLCDLGGRESVVRLKCPCLISVTRQANEPRLPSYLKWKTSRDRDVKVWGLCDLPQSGEAYFGLDGSPTRVERIFAPEKRRRRLIWEGTPQEVAVQFLRVVGR